MKTTLGLNAPQKAYGRRSFLYLYTDAKRRAGWIALVIFLSVFLMPAAGFAQHRQLIQPVYPTPDAFVGCPQDAVLCMYRVPVSQNRISNCVCYDKHHQAQSVLFYKEGIGQQGR